MTKFNKNTQYATDTISRARSRFTVLSSAPYSHIDTPSSGTSFLSKIFSKQQSRKTRQSELKRAAEITNELQRIDDEKGDLLQRIVRNQLQILRILALRNEYTKMATNTPGKRAQVTTFKKVTGQFIDQYIATYMLENSGISKKELTGKKREIEQILHDTFDLNNAQRNQFILLFANYLHLYNEREMILASRRDEQ